MLTKTFVRVLVTYSTGASVVLISAGAGRKPNMSRDDLFRTNATLIRDVSLAVARNCPQAILGIMTNPVNSTVPVAAETLRRVSKNESLHKSFTSTYNIFFT